MALVGALEVKVIDWGSKLELENVTVGSTAAYWRTNTSENSWVPPSP